MSVPGRIRSCQSNLATAAIGKADLEILVITKPHNASLSVGVDG